MVWQNLPKGLSEAERNRMSIHDDGLVLDDIVCDVETCHTKYGDLCSVGKIVHDHFYRTSGKKEDFVSKVYQLTSDELCWFLQRVAAHCERRFTKSVVRTNASDVMVFGSLRGSLDWVEPYRLRRCELQVFLGDVMDGDSTGFPALVVVLVSVLYYGAVYVFGENEGKSMHQLSTEVGPEVWDSVHKVIKNLPHACVIGSEVFLAHAGPPKSLADFNCAPSAVSHRAAADLASLQLVPTKTWRRDPTVGRVLLRRDGRTFELNERVFYKPWKNSRVKRVRYKKDKVEEEEPELTSKLDEETRRLLREKGTANWVRLKPVQAPAAGDIFIADTRPPSVDSEENFDVVAQDVDLSEFWVSEISLGRYFIEEIVPVLYPGIRDSEQRDVSRWAVVTMRDSATGVEYSIDPNLPWQDNWAYRAIAMDNQSDDLYLVAPTFEDNLTLLKAKHPSLKFELLKDKEMIFTFARKPTAFCYQPPREYIDGGSVVGPVSEFTWDGSLFEYTPEAIQQLLAAYGLKFLVTASPDEAGFRKGRRHFAFDSTRQYRAIRFSTHVYERSNGQQTSRYTYAYQPNKGQEPSTPKRHADASATSRKKRHTIKPCSYYE